ncbi:MAG: tRNA (adenosine(37)-N6)-threonylcarbamoyltransferase complex dimerization subunit type 1 TsaB [Bacteroidetes bacterium HGW-Bacteroidetes-8]|jgi:tRNA threonylcarbamoyladenosine biosynthesis protein TsaB|nr:MAG: tRNA (adenosine(37)-N6)-threonylcarbamoyltransferase complex dimerization subunit type 1 TsaB [Bacteroidetes bacterium HGW-Bacteroidetes-8]
MSTSKPLLLYIETSTEVCSVAISSSDVVLYRSVVREAKAHARIIAPMIEDLFKQVGFGIDKCDAVVVSEGPGSYTGLRVGVALAKGLCFASGKPLISVGSLDLLANLASDIVLSPTVSQEYSCVESLVPMIDARRMEVYTATYSKDATRLTPVEALVVDENSFADLLSKGVTLFCGDGSAKVSTIIDHPNARFLSLDSVAEGMVKRAVEKFRDGLFEDVAYFEPFYLKDFIAGVSKRGPLNMKSR